MMRQKRGIDNPGIESERIEAGTYWKLRYGNKKEYLLHTVS
jgi:hypothetical protein